MGRVGPSGLAMSLAAAAAMPANRTSKLCDVPCHGNSIANTFALSNRHRLVTVATALRTVKLHLLT